MKLKRICLAVLSTCCALSGQALQTAGSLVVDLDVASLSGLANNAVVAAWTNANPALGVFVPGMSTIGAGPVYNTSISGYAAVTFAGSASSVLTNTVTPPLSICGAEDWSIEAWVFNPAFSTTTAEDVLAWTAREMWPPSGATGSCLEFRFGYDGNVLEHYGNNVGWGSMPSANAWHYVAITRDPLGVERVFADGKLVNAASPAVINLRSDGSFTLGAVRTYSATNSASAWANLFSGSIARVRIHDGFLSSAAVSENYMEERAAFGLSGAGDVAWKGASDSALPWEDGANWSGGAAPSAASRVLIDNGGTAVVSAAASTIARFFPYRGGLVISNGASLTVPSTAGANVNMGWVASNAFSLVVKEGCFAMPGQNNHNLYLAGTDAGATVQLGGGSSSAVLDVDRDIQIGAGARGVARMTMEAGAEMYSSNGYVYVGVGGADAKLTVNGGLVGSRTTGRDLVVANNGSHGVLEVNGGRVAPSQNLVWSTSGNAATYGAVYLNGGEIEAYRFYPSSTSATNYFFLNGGTVRNRDSRSDFLYNLTGTYVQPGNAVFDILSNSWVSAAQPLLEDPAAPGGGIVKNGGGSLSLTGANTFTGDISVNAGDLWLRNANGLAAGYAGTITLATNTTIGLERAGGASVLIPLISTGSQGSLMLFASNATDTVDFSAHPGLGLSLYTGVSYTGRYIPYMEHYVFAPVVPGEVYPQAITNGLGVATVTVNGGTNGTIELTSAASSYTGGTTVNGGWLIMSHTSALGLETPGSPDIGIYNNASLKLNAAATPTGIVQRIKADSQGHLLLGAALTNLNVDLTGLPGVIVGTDQNTFNYAGVITPMNNTYRLGGGKVPYWWSSFQGLVLTNLSDAADGTPRQVVIEDGGLVRLTTARNTYSGGTVITNNGVVYLSDDGLGAVPAAPDPDNIYVNRGVIRVGSISFSLNANRGMVIGPEGLELHPWNGITMTVLGDLSGSGTIFTTDSGIIWFGGTNNTWDGVLDLRNGTMGPGAGNTFSWNRSATITNTTTGTGYFGVNANKNLTWSDFEDPLANNVGLRKTGTGALTVDVLPTYTRDTLIDAGTLKAGSAAPIPVGAGKGNVTIGASARLDVSGYDLAINGLSGAGMVTDTLATATQITVCSNNASVAFSGKIAFSLEPVKVGSGTWTLNNGAVMKDLRVEKGVVAPWDAVELAGSTFVASNATLRATNTNLIGLAGEYFDFSASSLQWITEPSNFTSLARITATLAPYTPAYRVSSGSFLSNFDTGSDGARFQGGFVGREYWVGRWTGKFVAETSGAYRFGTASDDGSLVFIDGQLAINNGFLQGYSVSQRIGPALELTNGLHDIQVVFFEKTGGNALTVYMIPPGATATNALPQRLLRHVLPAYVESLTGDETASLEFSGPSAGVTLFGSADAVFAGRVYGTNETVCLTKEGAGTQTLAGEGSLYGGLTSVSRGALALNTSGKYGPVVVATNATLVATNAVGLLGSYYNLTPANVGNTNPVFTSYAALESFFATNSAALWSGSHLFGPGFDTGRSNTGGTRMPPPFGPTGRSNFFTIWRGQLIAPVSGTYTFSLNSDDGSMIFIDGQTVVNNNYFQAYGTERSGTVSLTAGLHAIIIGFYQGGGDYGVDASVVIPGEAKQKIPNSMLRPVAYGIGPLSGGGAVSLPVERTFLRIDETAASTYAGGAAGVPSSGIAKAGPEKLMLTGDNDAFLGTWYLTAGSLQVGDGGTNGTLGGAEIITGAGTTLIFNRSDNTDYNGLISGEGAIVQAGSGRVRLTQVATNFTGTVNLSGAGGLTLSGTNAVLNAASIEGAGTLVLEDGGAVKASGETLGVPLEVVDEGLLKLTSTSSSLDRLALVSNTVLTVQYVGGLANTNYSLTVGTVAVSGGTGSVVMSPNGAGSGTLRISALEVGAGGVLSVSGKIEVSGGALTVTVPQELPRGLTLIGDFSGTDGLDLSGVTQTVIGAGSDASLLYRDKRLYIMRANGTMIVLR